MKTLLYHANCADGIHAAYYASKAHPDANPCPMYYQSKLPDLTGHDVICVDYCIDRQVLETLDLQSLTIIDHHKTTHEEMQGFDAKYPWTYLYSESRCGATLTWEAYFHYLTPPWIAPYIEDRDLWTWALPYSKEVDACVQSYPFTFVNCAMLETKGLEACVEEGAPILRYQSKLIRQAVAQAGVIEFEGVKVPIVNTSVLQSEIGAELAKDKPFAILWWNKDHIKRFCYSLRSEPGKGLDVGAIAQKFGGGGHQNAASFSAPWHMEQDGPLQEAQKQIADLTTCVKDLESQLKAIEYNKVERRKLSAHNNVTFLDG